MIYNSLGPGGKGEVMWPACLINMCEMIMKLATDGQQIGSKFIVTGGKELQEFFAANIFFAELHGQENCGECGSPHTVPSQGCCDRKVSQLCLHCSGAEEMAVEQVDSFNCAEAGKGPWGCPGGSLGTSRSFQKHPNSKHTRFLVNVQQSAARTRSCRMLLKPSFCKCAFSGDYLILQQLERH